MFEFFHKWYCKWKTGLCVGDLVLQDRPDSWSNNLLCKIIEIHLYAESLTLLVEEGNIYYPKGFLTYFFLKDSSKKTWPSKYIPLSMEERICKKIKELDKKFENKQKEKKNLLTT